MPQVTRMISRLVKLTSQPLRLIREAGCPDKFLHKETAPRQYLSTSSPLTENWLIDAVGTRDRRLQVIDKRGTFGWVAWPIGNK